METHSSENTQLLLLELKPWIFWLQQKNGYTWSLPLWPCKLKISLILARENYLTQDKSKFMMGLFHFYFSQIELEVNHKFSREFSCRGRMALKNDLNELGGMWNSNAKALRISLIFLETESPWASLRLTTNGWDQQIRSLLFHILEHRESPITFNLCSVVLETLICSTLENTFVCVNQIGLDRFQTMSLPCPDCVGSAIAVNITRHLS